jgi:hypothetical protein
MVGVSGFEPPTSASQTLRANQTALHPDSYSIAEPLPGCNLVVALKISG